MSQGRRLRDLREAAGLSQAQLAKLAGVTRNAVSQWEAGTTQPSTKRLGAVARALNVPVDRIVASNSQLREQIVAAATRLFDRLGFEETSVDVLCASADVSTSDFHSLFENKQELLYEVLKAYNERTFADVRRTPPKFGALDVRLKHLLHTYYLHDLEHIKLTAAFLAFSWQWSADRERDNSRQLSDHHYTVATLLEAAMNEGQIRPGNLVPASQLIFAAYTASLRKAVFEGFNADKLIAFIEPQLMLILKGLGWGAMPPSS